MPFKTGLVFTYDCGDFARGMDMALSLADHAGFEQRRAEARARGKLRGLGIANPIEVAGGPYTAMQSGHRRAAREPGRLGVALRRLDLDGPGQRDGLRPDRQ